MNTPTAHVVSYDLHLHSYWSYDASANPLAYFQHATEHGMRCLAITEHHQTDSLAEVLALADRFPSIRVIPAAELTVNTSIGAVDLLCYRLPVHARGAWQKLLDAYHAWQCEYGEAMCRGMQALGLDYTRNHRMDLLRTYRPARAIDLQGCRPLDVAQSQADLAGTRAAMTQAQTDAANARSALARLMGVPAVTGPLTDHFEPPTSVADLAWWQDRATTERQDLLAMVRSVEAARASLEAAIRQYFPSVSINFNYYLHTDPTSAINWTGGISANIPLFSALTIEADIRRAWSVYRQLDLVESQTRRQVVDDINQSFHNFQGSRRKIADLQVQVEAAQRAFDLAERAYQLGSISNLDRLTQQDNLLAVQLNLISERFSEKSYYLGLLRSAGSLASVMQ